MMNFSTVVIFDVYELKLTLKLVIYMIILTIKINGMIGFITNI